MSSRKVCDDTVTGCKVALATGMATCMLSAGACGVGCCVVRGVRCAV